MDKIGFDNGFDSVEKKKILLRGLLHKMDKKHLSEKETFVLHQLKKRQKFKEVNKLTPRQLMQAVKRNRRALHANRNKPFREKSHSNKPTIFLICSVASVLLILLVFNLYNSLQHSTLSSEKEMVQNHDVDLQFTTDKNMKRITLADGSTVHLNRESSVSLRKGTFNAHNREIWLEEGEAFFEIKRDIKRPFIVHTNKGVSTHVLGTSFNIKSYEELSYQEISVVSGKVQVENTHNKIIIEPNYKVAVNNVDGQFTSAKTNSRAIAQWRTGSIIFQEAPFAEVAFRIRQYYDMEVVYDSEEFNNDRIYTQFTSNTPIEEIAAVISKLTNATFKIDDKGIYMYKK